MMIDGSVDQYLRIVAYNLSILFCLMLSMNVNGMKYVLRATAILLFVQQLAVWARLLGHPEYIPFIQTWMLTSALWILVIVLAITIMAIWRVKQ